MKILESKRGIFYGWWVVFACALIIVNRINHRTILPVIASEAWQSQSHLRMAS